MIRFADWQMRGELTNIWKECFQEPARPARYFLNNYFRPENALVYQLDGKIAAVVYLLPAQLAKGNGSVQAHYIYAAATLPEYRSRGYMGALLHAAERAGEARKDCYSIVLPADSGLYPLYEKSGYTPYFQIKTAAVSLSSLCDLAQGGSVQTALFTWSQLNALRRKYLVGTDGSVLWSDEAFSFAVGMGKVYGDRLVCSRTGNKPAYALCRRIDDDTCKVMEIMADEGTFPDLAANIITSVPAQMYYFRLPAGDTRFPEAGEKSVFGMMKPVGKAAPEFLQSAVTPPYLGLPLD